MIRPKKIIGLDFETYYDNKYSLRSKDISTSEYVRDPRFEVQCCAIQSNRSKHAKVFYGDQIKPALDKIDWSTTGLLAHNTAFDGLILSHHYGHIPSYYYDTMSMARTIIGHDVGAGLDEVLHYYDRTGKLDGGAALQRVKGIRLSDQSREQRVGLGKYCAVDVEEMWWLFREWADYPQDELDLIHLSINAFANPVLDVDKTRCRAELKRATEERARLFNRVSKLIDLTEAAEKIRKDKPKREAFAAMNKDEQKVFLLQTALRSGDDFAAALKRQGQTAPKKKNPKGKTIYAFAKTDLDFIALGKSHKSTVRDLYEAKLEASSSINITRASRLLQRVEKPGWRLPIMLNYCKAHTFRWSGGDKLNPQNFPARGRNGAELRRSVIAPRGYKVVVVDSSQIEARMNAWFWDHFELLKIFSDSDKGLTKDPYCHQADRIYNRPITKAEEQERFVGKVAVLGLGYQMGAPKFQYTLESGSMGPPVFISLREAHTAVDAYRTSNQPIENGWNQLEGHLSMMVEGIASEHKCVAFDGVEVHMPNGLALHYPELSGEFLPWKNRYGNFEYRNKYTTTNLYGGKFNENIIQSLARIVVGQQMLRIADSYRIVMMSHDEVVFLAPTKEADKALELSLEHMRWTPDWCAGIPLNAEGKVAPYYSK